MRVRCLLCLSLPAREVAAEAWGKAGMYKNVKKKAERLTNSNLNQTEVPGLILQDELQLLNTTSD